MDTMFNKLSPLLFVLGLATLLPAQSTWHVPDDFSTIQAGIDGSSNGDTVIVRDGTYFENINFNGKAITLKSENGPATTIIDGNQAGNVVRIESGEGSDSVFEGFTVTNGNAFQGGGMYCRNDSSPTLTDCTFTNNTATYGSGGMFSYSSSPTLTDCTFTNNTASYEGGGMVCNEYSSPTLNNCTFTNNTANDDGGGMVCSSSTPTLTDCTFADNTARDSGGGAWFSGSPSTLDNCTFTNNTATYGSGGGMFCFFSSPTLDNCIFWNNNAPLSPEISVSAGNPNVTYSDVEGGYSGAGNINADPLFVDPANNDFHLKAGSPCIDTGDPNSPLDPDGTPADMGAFYFHGGAPTLSVTSLVAGQATLVEVTNATPNNFSHFAWSVHGGGPISTPFGDAMITPPYHRKLLPTDSMGYASYTANIPLHAAGVKVWCHGTDVGTQSMLNALMLVIQ